MSPNLAASISRLLRYRGRIFRRLVAEHAFVLFVLGPVILGALSWVLHRYLWALREPVALALEFGSATATDRLCIALAMAFALALWPGSLGELFGRARGGQDLVDTLPVSETARLGASVVAAIGRSLIPAACFLAAVATLATVETRPWHLWIPAVILAMAHLAVLDLLLAALAVRLGFASLGRIVAFGSLAVFVLIQPWPAARWLLWPLGVAGASLRDVLEACLGVAGPAVAIPAALPSATALACVLLAAVVLRYRRRDIERGQALDRSSRQRSIRFASPSGGWLGGRIDPVMVAQLRRDLRLVARRFSPAVQVAAALVLLAVISAVLLGLDRSQSELWRRQAMVIGLAVSVLGSVSIVPFLLKYQLPVFWIEKSMGVAQGGIWRSKIWLSVLLASPATLLGIGLVLALAPGTVPEKVAAALQLLAAAGVLGSLVGLAAFEMPEEPLVSVIFSGLLGSAAASLFVFYGSFWWLWLVFYGWIAGQLAERSVRRVDILEVER